MWTHRKRRIGLLALGAALLAPVGAGPRLHVSEQGRWVLGIRPINATLASEPPPPLVVLPATGGSVEFEVAWPEPDSASVVRLQALEIAPASAGGTPGLAVRSELTLPDGRRVRASRELRPDGSDTVLFEVARENDRPLTLALEVEFSLETVLLALPTAGPPVQFLLEIRRVESNHEIPLESNRLSTMVGEWVSYAFRLSPEESAEIRLRPLRLYDDVVQLEVEITGTLPGEDELKALSRREEWLATRGATSTLSLEVGDPPTGYRFLITPRF